MSRLLSPAQLTSPDSGIADFSEPGHTPKFDDNATAEYKHQGWTIRRYNPYAYWRVVAYEGGSIPPRMQGVYTSIEAFRDSVATYERLKAS